MSDNNCPTGDDDGSETLGRGCDDRLVFWTCERTFRHTAA